MTRVSLSVTMQDFTKRLVAALEARDLSEGEAAQFNADWQALEAAGAEMLASRFVDGVIQVFPTEEFTAHCAKWGIHP